MTPYQKIIIIVGVLIISVGAYFFMVKDSKELGADVEIMDRFDDKVVYTTDISLDEEPFRAHCKLEGGLFNSCGSPCPTDEGVCASVCAYTCEEVL